MVAVGSFVPALQFAILLFNWWHVFTLYRERVYAMRRGKYFFDRYTCPDLRHAATPHTTSRPTHVRRRSRFCATHQRCAHSALYREEDANKFVGFQVAGMTISSISFMAAGLLLAAPVAAVVVYAVISAQHLANLKAWTGQVVLPPTPHAPHPPRVPMHAHRWPLSAGSTHAQSTPNLCSCSLPTPMPPWPPPSSVSVCRRCRR